MEITNNINSCSNIKTMHQTMDVATNEDFDIRTSNTGEPDEKLLGIGFLNDSNNNTLHYGMKAEYAKDFSFDNPIITITIQKGYGQTEEYSVNIRNVNPHNATEIEMFALCSYMDASGNGTGNTFGSWQTLNYYRNNASQNGYFETSNTTELFTNLKQDWIAMINLMIRDYKDAGLYKQNLDGEKLLNIFNLIM